MNPEARYQRNWLIRRIASLELTPEQFALRCRVQKRALLSWISGRTTPNPIGMHRLATAFGCDVVEIEDEFARERWIGKRGKWIAATRRRLCLSQEELAARLGVACSRISVWERDLCTPRLRNRRLIAEALQASISEINAAYAQHPNSTFRLKICKPKNYTTLEPRNR